MFVSETEKVIFIHIPRTGGGSIKNCLGNGRIYSSRTDKMFNHSTIDQIREKKPEWKDYTTCTVVRDEEDWRKSLWQFSCPSKSYKQWIKKRNIIQRLPKPLQTIRQSDWYDDNTILFNLHEFA